MKPLQPNETFLEEQCSATYFLDVDAGANGRPIEVADLFKPETWSAWAKMLGPSDRIRVKSRSRGFDFFVVVVAIAQHGVIVEPWPRLPPGIDTMDALRATARVLNDLHQSALQRRVFGTDSPEEAA